MSWTDKVKNVEYVCLKGQWYVRPAGSLGSCGFHPVPWELKPVKRKEKRRGIRRH